MLADHAATHGWPVISLLDEDKPIQHRHPERVTVLSLRRHIPLLTLSLTLAMASVALALRLGSADIPSAEVWAHVIADDGSINDRIIDQLRLPRALTAFAVGGLLALAGALIQVLLRNPLGDPYVLGCPAARRPRC